jgi:hypothetical protein
MWSRIFAAAASSLLVSCAPVAATSCPPLVEYDRSFMGRLADEVEALPEGSALMRAVLDYRRLRDVVRACRS